MPHKVRFLRIDDRLIHGQVIVGWLPILEVECLTVINEKVSSDTMRQEMMGMSVPSEVSLKFFSPDNIEFAEIPEGSLVLVSSPKDAWICLQSGMLPETLNVGGLHSKPGKEEIMEAFHIDDEDRCYLIKLLESDTVPMFQPTPQNEPVPLTEII